MNHQSIKKETHVGTAILAVAASSLFILLCSAVITFFLCKPVSISLIIAVIVIPSVSIVWLLASMTAYIIEKYKNRVSRGSDINLRASSLTLAVILFLAVAAIFISGIGFGVDLISTLYGFILS